MKLFFSQIFGKILAGLRFLRVHLKVTIAVGILLLILGSVYAVTRPKAQVFVTAAAERGDIRQTVEAVGTIISEKDLELQFPTVDIVSQVLVQDSQKVKAGQRLATLRSGSLAASVASASANVQSARAQLQQLEEGSRPEDIQIAEAQVANKRASLEAAKQTVRNAEENIVTAESQLITLRNEAAISLSGQVSTAGSAVSQHIATTKTALLVMQGVFNANDVQDSIVKSSVAAYDSMMVTMTSVQSELNTLQTSVNITDYQSALQAIDRARASVSRAADILNQAYDILSSLQLTTYFTNTSRETNKTTIATQKSNVQSALSALDTALKSLRDASAAYDTKISSQQAEIKNLQGTRDRTKADISTYQTSLQIDEAQLNLKKAPARKTDIDAATARLRQAQAELSRAAAQFNDTILVAPVDGIVTKVNVKVGQIRPSTTPSITMLGDSPYRIEMFVSEVDIPKAKVTQTGSITLDAFREIAFALRVSDIDAAATDKDGVPKYRIKLDFVYHHDDLKVGMTGDAVITTGMRKDVVSVPVRSVLENEDGSKYVRILHADGKSFEERTVETGMEGEGGTIEVTGVEEGEQVVVLIKS